MNDNGKMKLSDLKLKQEDPIDWNTLDEFFYKDVPEILIKPLVLTNVIKENNVLATPGIDGGVITNYLSGMAKDTQALSGTFAEMKNNYESSKQRYQGNYNEDAHMFSLTISFAMQEWLEQYENTVGRNLNDIIDYINSLVPNDNQINP